MRRALVLWMGMLLLAMSARAAVIAPVDDGFEDRLAAARQIAADMPVGHYGMTPIPAASVAEGVYPVSVESSSTFFRVLDATLEVRDGAMNLTFSIGSDSYARVCRALAADAEAASWIEGEAVPAGTRFTVPVPALNQPFELAAYSRKRQRWYDRWLLVDAASLPREALGFELPDYALLEKVLLDCASENSDGGDAEAIPPEAAEPVAVDLPDGAYAIEVSLSGGSGRASVSSPTMLMVREGRAWARLLWSSAYYDYMLVGGTRYDNLSTEGGNSSFEIPVPAMDAPVRVVADTTAMGDPVEIEYRLTFYAETIGDRSQVPQEAAKRVLMISLAMIVVLGVLNHFAKKRRAG